MATEPCCTLTYDPISKMHTLRDGITSEVLSTTECQYAACDSYLSHLDSQIINVTREHLIRTHDDFQVVVYYYTRGTAACVEKVRKYSPLGDTPYLMVKSSIFRDKPFVNALNLFTSLQIKERSS